MVIGLLGSAAGMLILMNVQSEPVGLAYAALYFGDPDMAEEVGELEERMDALVHDMRSVCVLAARHPLAPGEVFTIGGPRYTTLNELVRLIARTVGVPEPRLRVPYWPVYASSVVCERLFRVVGRSPPLYPRRVEFFSKDRAFDITKSQRMLGFEPAVDLEAGLARTAEWYRMRGLL
jgi:nucleoside-diphosphate-sugar epimerase